MDLIACITGARYPDLLDRAASACSVYSFCCPPPPGLARPATGPSLDIRTHERQYVCASAAFRDRLHTLWAGYPERAFMRDGTLKLLRRSALSAVPQVPFFALSTRMPCVAPDSTFKAGGHLHVPPVPPPLPIAPVSPAAVKLAACAAPARCNEAQVLSEPPAAPAALPAAADQATEDS
eukprot:2273878-Pyramimonas_sp.AAC.1